MDLRASFRVTSTIPALARRMRRISQLRSTQSFIQIHSIASLGITAAAMLANIASYALGSSLIRSGGLPRNARTSAEILGAVSVGVLALNLELLMSLVLRSAPLFTAALGPSLQRDDRPGAATMSLSSSASDIFQGDPGRARRPRPAFPSFRGR